MAVPDYLQDFVTDCTTSKTTFSAPLDPKTFGSTVCWI